MTQGGVKWKLRQILFWAGSQSQIIYQLWLHLFSTFPLALLEKKTVYFLLNVQLRRVIFLKSAAVARDTDFETLTSAANQRSIVHFSKSLIHLSSFHSTSKLCCTAEHWLMCQISQNGDWIQDCIFELVFPSKVELCLTLEMLRIFTRLKRAQGFQNFLRRVVFLQVCILIGKVLPWLFSTVPHKLCSFCLRLCHKRNFKSQGEIDWKGV